MSVSDCSNKSDQKTVKGFKEGSLTSPYWPEILQEEGGQLQMQTPEMTESQLRSGYT